MIQLASDKFRVPDRPLNRPVRLVVSDVFRSTGVSSGYCLSGRLESGMIQSGDKLLLMPLNESILIKGLCWLTFDPLVVIITVRK